jgi:hypothetical protein
MNVFISELTNGRRQDRQLYIVYNAVTYTTLREWIFIMNIPEHLLYIDSATIHAETLHLPVSCSSKVRTISNVQQVMSMKLLAESTCL